jgi:hypothetical protein
MSLTSRIESSTINILLDETKIKRVERAISKDFEKCSVLLVDERCYVYEITDDEFEVISSDYPLSKDLHIEFYENVKKVLNLETADEIIHSSNNCSAVETKNCIGVFNRRIERYFRNSKKPIVLHGTKKYYRLISEKNMLV